jgi:broad specificity phosphatase PhoE
VSNTVVGLLRHGQTDWNIDLRLQGTTDIPLNQVGIEQVSRAADLLDRDWDVILSSPLSRAQDSAEIVARELGGMPVAIEPKLLERSFGIGEGMTYGEWQEKFADLDHIPGAESKAQIEARALDLLNHLATNYAGLKVLTVSHGALIRFVLSEVTNGAIPPKGERLLNASLHVIRHQGDWSLDAWAPNPLGS